MASRIIRAIVPDSLKQQAHEAWLADGSPTIIQQDHAVSWYEDSKSDHFEALHQLFIDNKVAFDCSYFADGEQSRKWFCYRPETKSGVFIHGIAEDPDPDCKSLAEC